MSTETRGQSLAHEMTKTMCISEKEKLHHTSLLKLYIAKNSRLNILQTSTGPGGNMVCITQASFKLQNGWKTTNKQQVVNTIFPDTTNYRVNSTMHI